MIDTGLVPGDVIVVEGIQKVRPGVKVTGDRSGGDVRHSKQH